MQKTIFGRRPVREFVRQHLAPPGRAEAQGTRPMLVIEGGPGSGRSAVVDALAGDLHGKLPYARFDLAAVEGRMVEHGMPKNSARPLLAAIACHWGQHCPPYGYLGFPRLAIAFAALQLHRSGTSQKEVRRDVDKQVRAVRRARAAGAVLAVAAGELARPLPAPVGSRSRGVQRTLEDRSHRGRSRHREWFREQDEAGRASIEVLADLNRRAGEGASAYEKIDELLWRALLADLREGFERGRHHARRSANAVLLLDNADSLFGRRLLRQLAEAPLTQAHPLTVVAAAGPALCDYWGRHSLVRDAAETAADVAPEAPAPQVLRCRLSDLTDGEVLEVVDAGVRHLPQARHPAQGRRTAFARELHEFTLGHPGATQSLVDAALSAEAGPLNLTAALAAPHDSDTVERHLLRVLLRGSDDAALRGLEVCAAARNRSDAAYLIRVPGLVDGDHVETPANLWSDHDRRTPTLVRRLLLRGLDRRADKRARVYESLVDRSTGRDDDAEYYYRLARDDRESSDREEWDIVKVARGLEKELGRGSTADWVGRLTTIAQAPRPTDAAVVDNAEEAARAVLWEIDQRDPERREPETAFHTIVGLLVRSWIAADPLCGQQRASLHRQLHTGFEKMKDYLGDRDEVLQGEVDEHDRLAALWSDVGVAGFRR